MRDKTRPLTFRPDIEGLRGLAVLIVVAFHCGIGGFSGGFVGVDVFFVLSGYLITGLLVAEIQNTSRLSLSRFYARRVRRLLPAAALVLLVTLAVAALILAPQELTVASRAARATAVYMSNIFFSTNAADYFAPGVETNPMLHTWSLAVEEQFYLFWPLLIMLGLQYWKSGRALLRLLLGLTAMSLAVCIWLTANGQVSAFYELPARAWEFGIGGLAVLVPHGRFKLPARGWSVLGWLGVLAVLGSARLISGDLGFPGWVALFPVMGTAAALVAGAEQPNGGPGVLLRARPMQALGKLSYSWYLWHWPLLVFAAALLPNISTAGRAAAAAVALVAAAISHRLVENPIRFHPYLIKRPALSLGLAAGVTLGSLGAATLAMRIALRLAHAPDMVSISTAVDDVSRLPRQRCVALGQSTELTSCVFGDTSSTTNIVLFGDSHAIQWFNPLQRIAESRRWKVTTLVKSACPAADIGAPGQGAPFSSACNTWRAKAIRRILALHPSVVVVANATGHLGIKTRSWTKVDISSAELLDGTRRTLKALSEPGLAVLMIRDNPAFSIDIPTCLARSVRHSWYPGGECEMAKSASLNPAVFEAEQNGARGLANVQFLDVTDRLCGAAMCWAVHDDMIIYRDDNHLTGRFADSLRPVLEERLLPIASGSARRVSTVGMAMSVTGGAR